MAKHSRFITGRLWSEAPDLDPLIQNELERLKLRRYYRPVTSDRLPRKNQRMLLRYLTGQSFMYWRRKSFIPGITGIQCVLFINNSEKSSLELLEDAVVLARSFWLESPLFVHINPRLFPDDAEKIFQKAGWKFQGKSKEGFPIYIYDQPF